LKGITLAIGALLALLVLVAPAAGAEKNVRLVDNLPEAANATAINFLEYKSRGRGDDGHRGRDRDDDDDRGKGRDRDDDDDRDKGRHRGDDDDRDRGDDRRRGDDDDDDRGRRGDDDDDDRFARTSGRKGGKSLDVMLVTGRFGLKTYSLADRDSPELLGELTAEELRLPGDPPVDFTPVNGTPKSTYWQNEDMDIDEDRKLALLSRDPRAYGGSTTREPGEADPNNATNIAGVYVVDVRDPRNPQILSFEQLPTGHTTTCINDCKWLWTGGPAATTTQQANGWTFGRPIIVTDLSDPRDPRGYPMNPVDLFRRDGVTAYSHDVQVDDMGIAWVSGDGGTRGYWTEGKHFDPLEGERRRATPLDPIPYAGGGLPASVTGDEDGGFEHNAWRPVGRDAPKGDRRYKKGELLLATEEDFGPAAEACANRGQFSIASLDGSYDGEAWRSTATSKFRLEVVGKWSPAGQEGSRPVGGPYDPLADFCSAHYFDVDGSVVSYAWYGEGTRFLDISDPENPRQFAYWRPDDGIVWASYYHKGYVYTADRTRGVDVLQFTRGAFKARRSSREVVAPSPSAKQRRFVARVAAQYTADRATAGICFLQSQ